MFQDGPRLFHVEASRLHANSESLFRQGKDALLDADVLLGNLDALLGNPELHVVRRHVGQQGYQGIVIAVQRCVQVGIGRLDGPAETSPEIQLPA